MAQSTVEALFLDAVSAAVHGRRVQWKPLPAEQWLALFRLAEQQKLLPLLADAALDHSGAAEDPVCAAARGTARRQVLEQAQKDAAFLPVYRRLREAGIDALVIKGSLCRSVYPNGGLRISADEDLLVPEADFAEACRIFDAFGLHSAPGSDPLHSAEIGWHGANGLLYIELHKYLFAPDSGPFSLLQTVFRDVFSRARDYPLDGDLSLRSLSPHDHLLYLLLHAMKHFIRTGFGLRQICDVGLWASHWGSEIDWALLEQQTQSVNGKTFCAALFEIAEQRLGIAQELPAFWRENVPDPKPMLQDLLEGGIYGSATRSREHTARITQDAVCAQQRGKQHSLRTALFPPAKALESDYPVLKSRPVLLPLIWQKRLTQYLLHSLGSRDDRPADTVKLGRKRLELLREYGILEKE